MTERWCIPRQLGRASLLTEVAALASQLGEGRAPTLHVVAPPLRTYHGKQARRTAFYRRQRDARRVQRVLNAAGWAANAEYHAAMLDALRYGMGVLEHIHGCIMRVDPAKVG